VEKKLKILILESVSAMAEMMVHALKKGGIAFTGKCVKTKGEFLNALNSFSPDIILADYKLPSIGGIAALSLVKQQRPDTPFIFVSDMIGEDFAIEIFKKGATDYVFKNRISRLVPAVHRAIHESEINEERKRTEKALKESELMLRSIIEHSNELFYIHDTHHTFTFLSPQTLQILGYTSEEMMIEWTTLLTANPINKLGMEITDNALRTGVRQPPYILEVYRKDGTKVWLEIDESPLKDGQGEIIGIVGAARDISERIRTEEVLAKNQKELKKRISELEEFYDMAIGRELRMIELKQEIEGLREKLGKYTGQQ
jgi:PAS domain S-box-containing protein